MEYVKHFNLFGVETKEIPCIDGNGSPTNKTVGAVGCLYMNTSNGDLYKCISASNGVYQWVFVGQQGPKGEKGDPGPAGDTPKKGVDYWTPEDQAEIVDAVLAALPNGDEVAY